MVIKFIHVLLIIYHGAVEKSEFLTEHLTILFIRIKFVHDKWNIQYVKKYCLIVANKINIYISIVVGLKARKFTQKELYHRCFLANFEQFLRKAFSQNTSGRLLLIYSVLELFQRVFALKIFQDNQKINKVDNQK